MKKISLTVASALALLSMPVLAQDAPETAAEADAMGSWITLGTNAGPVTKPTRSQPANLLRFNGKDYLIDVGDGAAGQMSKVGIQTKMIDAIFISHLHFDHIGGLAALLGLRVQTTGTDPLTIYGPPGTSEMVEGLLAAIVPSATSNYGVPGAPTVDHRAGIEIIELRDGDSFDLNGMTVTVRNNTHYSFPEGSELASRFESHALRFDLPGRSFVYTGDTGPSTAVEELAEGADILVAEMMDIPLTIERLLAANPSMPERAAVALSTHLSEHHLSPTDVGEMATRAGVGAIVVTHFSGWEVNEPGHLQYLQEIAAVYDGLFVIADDMDTF